jgi:hypothetical protein
MRTINASTKKQVWRLEIDNLDGTVYMDKNYSTLEEIANELNMTYNQICDIKNNRIKKRPLMPNIKINRRLPTQVEFYKDKRILKEKCKENEKFP